MLKKFDAVCDWLAKLYVNTLNIIHYMHDKYCYEKLQMALHDDNVLRTMAGGIAGLSVVADSLSAIRYAKVKPVRDETGLAVDFITEGDFPKFGNNDPRVDSIACDVVKRFMGKTGKMPDLSGSEAYAFYFDHYIKCGLRQKDGLHTGRPQKGRAICTGRQPHAWAGQQRLRCFHDERGEAALRLQ